MASSLWQLSAVQTAQGIRDGDFSASEVLESVLERVADVNPRLNAIVYDCSDEARETAARADRMGSTQRQSPAR